MMKKESLKIPGNDIVQQANNLCTKFERDVEKILISLGTMTAGSDLSEAGRTIVNRFHSNIICIQNHLNHKDTLSAVLIARYNHELFIDFYYLFSDGGENEKVKKYFEYKEKSQRGCREWSSFSRKDKRKFLPSDDGLDRHYKFLSDYAHPNIISLHLQWNENCFEFWTIIRALTLLVTEISIALSHEKFVGTYDLENYYENTGKLDDYVMKFGEISKRYDEIVEAEKGIKLS